MRQPGSSFKPYVYATALMNGFTPKSVVRDAPICLGNWCPQNYGRSYSGNVTLLQALTRSINIIPVRLSVMLGKGNPKIGRAMIIQTTRSMGITAPLPDTPSMPIGADEVTVLDHTVAYATFPNRGKAVQSHALLEVRTGAGQLVWRFDRDGRKPRQVLPPRVADDMVMMMHNVVQAGTARRAQIPGVQAAGKTGTTNAYRDAWFVGYTGNYVCGVWFGNDDYSPLNRMTGGSLPAMTWQKVMTYAHQGIELKPLPGLPPAKEPRDQVAAKAGEKGEKVPERPPLLTQHGAEILVKVERMMDEAARALAAPSTTPAPVSAVTPPAARDSALASASRAQPPVRGN
jgi:penicillin-binding protein 1A